MFRKPGFLDLILPLVFAGAAAIAFVWLWNDSNAPRVKAVVQSTGEICDVVWGSTGPDLNRSRSVAMACPAVQAYMAASPRNDYRVVHRQTAMLTVTMPDGSLRSHEEGHIERMLQRKVKRGETIELLFAGELLGFEAPMKQERRDWTLWIGLSLLGLSLLILAGLLYERPGATGAPPIAT